MRTKRKLIDSLMGFYQVISTVYLDSEKWEDDDVRGLMINAHLDYLFNFHKGLVEKYKIPIPKTKKLFKEYIDGWNKTIVDKNPALSDILEELSCRKSRSYII